MKSGIKNIANIFCKNWWSSIFFRKLRRKPLKVTDWEIQNIKIVGIAIRKGTKFTYVNISMLVNHYQQPLGLLHLNRYSNKGQQGPKENSQLWEYLRYFGKISLLLSLIIHVLSIHKYIH